MTVLLCVFGSLLLKEYNKANYLQSQLNEPLEVDSLTVYKKLAFKYDKNNTPTIDSLTVFDTNIFYDTISKVYTYTDTNAVDSINYIYRLITPSKINQFTLDLEIPELERRTTKIRYIERDKNHLYINFSLTYKVIDRIHIEPSINLTYLYKKNKSLTIGMTYFNEKYYPVVGIGIRIF